MKESIHHLLEPAYFKWVLIPRARCRQRKRIREIRKRGYAVVTFIVSSLPMWKFQGLCELLAQDSRFRVSIALYPFSSFSQEEKDASISALCSFFTEKGIPFVDLTGMDQPGKVLRENNHPDLLFYPQPYNFLFSNDLDNQFFDDCLKCYIPYAMLSVSEEWVYRSWFNETAWRLFYTTESERKEAEKYLYNRGCNIRIVGQCLSDVFASPVQNSVWKPQRTPKKRIIWAPHHSITEEGVLHRDSFTWASSFMWELTGEYQETVQFAFKPHPRLKSVLYDHPDWGPERTDAYYRQWAEGSNTQLETGSYIDLFKESDAMIHDCCSFSAEYHYTGNPVFFITRDVEAVIAPLNALGKEGVLAHYLGGSEAEIKAFIDDVVLAGNDSKKSDRQAYFEKFLRPPGGHSVAENIYNEILKGIGFKA